MDEHILLLVIGDNWKLTNNVKNVEIMINLLHPSSIRRTKNVIDPYIIMEMTSQFNDSIPMHRNN